MRPKHDSINMIYTCNQSLNIISIVASLPGSEFVNWEERRGQERQEQVERNARSEVLIVQCSAAGFRS